MIQIDENLEIIRDNSREVLIKDRQAHRQSVLNNFRTMEDNNDTPSISVSAIEKLAKQIKRKNLTNVSVLRAVKNGLLESPGHVDAFFHVTGALQALVRDLTGRNNELQVEAACCLCNLALGGPKISSTIMRAAGAYLHTYLNQSNPELVATCAWTIGNLCAADADVSLAVAKMGSINYLINLLNGENEDKDLAAVYALSHFVKNIGDKLETNELQLIVIKLLEILIAKRQTLLSSAYYWLMFLLTSKQQCDSLFINSIIVAVIVDKLELLFNNNQDVLLITPLLFSLGNLAAADVKIVKDILNCNKNDVLTNIFKKSLESDSNLVLNEAKRILGTMMDTCLKHKEENALKDVYDVIDVVRTDGLL